MSQLAQDWTKQVVDELLFPELQQHNKEVDYLIEKNNNLQGSYATALSFQGVTYYAGGASPRKLQTHLIHSLHKDLFSDMQRRVMLWRQVQSDKKTITQLFHQMLQPCISVEEIRDALPECMVAQHPQLLVFPRTMEAAWTFKDKPMAMRQYLKILPKIETYCAMRFIY